MSTSSRSVGAEKGEGFRDAFGQGRVLWMVRDDAWAKVLSGVTSIEEVPRVVA